MNACGLSVLTSGNHSARAGCVSTDDGLTHAAARVDLEKKVTPSTICHVFLVDCRLGCRLYSSDHVGAAAAAARWREKPSLFLSSCVTCFLPADYVEAELFGCVLVLADGTLSHIAPLTTVDTFVVCCSHVLRSAHKLRLTHGVYCRHPGDVQGPC